MRELKFRAWDPVVKMMAPPLTIQKISGIGVKPPPDMIFMQYTGLKDKNDNEIYEGDIVVGGKGAFRSKVTGVVKFHGLSFVFEGTSEDMQYAISGGEGSNYWRYTITNPDIKNLPEIEVIGNIYQNPELLKAGKPCT